MQKTKRKNLRAGFTLTEVIVILVVIALIAAVTIPSMISFIRHGHQINRTNIARTLYISMQNQLSRAVNEGNLRSLLTEDFYERDALGNLVIDVDNDYFQFKSSAATNPYWGLVSDRLDDFPEEDKDNESCVFFISKPAGYDYGEDLGDTDTTRLVANFYSLLDEIIINKDILDGAILMEFNVRTGVVMSIFYGDDHGGQTQFGYGTDFNIGNGSRRNGDITGGRGMEGANAYTEHYNRMQGYFGVNFTGVAPPLPIEDIVRIFDGMDYDDMRWTLDSNLDPAPGLNVGTDAAPIRKTNILFAEFLLRDPLANNNPLLIFDDEYDGTGVEDLITITNPVATPIPDQLSAFYTALDNSRLNPLAHALYKDTITSIVIEQFGVGIHVGGTNPLFHRYILVLDFIEGDILGQPRHHNISTKYPGISEPYNIRARVTMPDGTDINSLMFANTHFASRWHEAAAPEENTYEVRSVRHLNNIRHASGANFIQTEDIDVRTLINEGALPGTPAYQLYNFGPIETFSGTYDASYGTGSHKRIENLWIDTVGQAAFLNGNVGLFSRINGGDIIGVSLINASVNATNATNVGAIAGEMTGNSTISRSNVIANVFGANTGTSNTGGLVGRIEAGSTLSHSFNAGLYNAYDANPPATWPTAVHTEHISRTNEQGRFGSVTAHAGNIGGLVGENSGTIQFCFNNARVNIFSVVIDTDNAPYYLSRNPTSILLQPGATARLGGIAGDNTATGMISRSYATNHVAVYPHTQNVDYGGIAGRNAALVGICEYSRFINHSNISDIGAGVITPERRGVSKEDLMEMVYATGSPSFRPDVDRRDRYLDEDDDLPKNTYNNYPYPLLSNNMPFENTPGLSWGWEDIEESLIEEIALLYFELYADGSYGFCFDKYIDSTGSFNPPAMFQILGRLQDNRPVRQAGYMLVSTYSSVTGLRLLIRPGTTPHDDQWDESALYPLLFEDDVPEGMAAPGSQLRFCILDLRESEHGVLQRLNLGVLGAGGCLISCDTPQACRAAGCHRNIPLQFAATFDANINDSNLPADVEIIYEDEGYFHPFFAKAISDTSDFARPISATSQMRTYEIRTPWQMQNINRVTTGTPFIPGEPGSSGNAEPPPEPAGGHTYATTGTISRSQSPDPARPPLYNNPHYTHTTYGNNIPIGTNRDVPNVRITHWIGQIRDGAMVGSPHPVNPAVTPLLNASSVPVGRDRIDIANGNITLVGDFSGINIRRTDQWGHGVITLGSAAIPFEMDNTDGETKYIYAAGQGIRLHVSPGMVMENVLVAHDSESQMVIASSLAATGRGPQVRINALFYTRSELTGRLEVQNWDSGSLPQFYAGGSGGINNFTMTGSAAMSGVFYSGGDTRINLPGVTSFNGLFYSNAGTAGWGTVTINPGTFILNEIDHRPGINIALPPILPGLGVLNQDVQDYLIGKGWTFPPGGGTPGPGTDPVPALTTMQFLQDRNISISNDRGPPPTAGDGTTPGTITNAVVTGDFCGIYDGRGHIIEHLNVTNQPNIQLFAANSGTIQSVQLRNSNITGSGNVGGITGINSGNILRTAVEYSTVTGVSGNVGGIAGTNTEAGRIEDVYFLSIAGLNAPPVSNNGGGIVGHNHNDGIINQVLYLAPAPRAGNNMYPIVRTGTGVDTGQGATGFYLSGFRHSLNQGINWINEHYNLRGTNLVPINGGNPLITDFIDLEWLNFHYDANFTRELWHQPASGYPYPALSGLNVPTQWPQADSPVRPDQVDRQPFGASTPPFGSLADPSIFRPTVNRAGNVGFINSNFRMDMMNPVDPSDTREILDPANTTRGYWMEDIPPRIFRPDNPANFASVDEGEQHGYRFAYYDHRWMQGWNTRPINPDGPTGYDNPLWHAIELQRPHPSGWFGLTITDFRGEPDGIFAELNAEVPGTLYQICPTVPGTEVYYSFYHARRNHRTSPQINLPGDPGLQRMNFYLSGMRNVGGEWEYSDGSGEPTIIRPCITPRGTARNQANTRRTVAYGPTSRTLNTEPVTDVERVWFYDPVLDGMRYAFLIDIWVADTVGTISPIGSPNTIGGHGITFWYEGTITPVIDTSNAPVTSARLNEIPREGVRNISTARSTALGNTPFLLPAHLIGPAQNNVIGYWDVRRFDDGTGGSESAGAQFSEWKQYYGLFTIPQGQYTTEFAFESGSEFAEDSGNYLSEVTFRSPGFLSIDKYVTLENRNVMFVQPGNTLTVELAVKNWGEVAVDNIVITDQFAPYDAYIEFVQGTVVVQHVQQDGIVTTIPPQSITNPITTNNHTLTITLPQATSLTMDEELLIRFDIRVRDDTPSDEPPHDPVSTLLYYFRNEARITWFDAEHRGYSFSNNLPFSNLPNGRRDLNREVNVSGPEPVQVFIDPIHLDKTIESATGYPPFAEGVRPGDQPFYVTLSVRNATVDTDGPPLPIRTRGIITDVIPAGFTIDTSGLPDNHEIIDNLDGSRRIIIPNVNLTPQELSNSFTYRLQYTGQGFGVISTSISSEYRYLYQDESDERGIDLSVMMRFPQSIVTVTPKTVNDNFTAYTDTVQTFNILDNDWLSQQYADENYDIDVEVVLFDSEENHVTTTNPNGDLQFTDADRGIVIILLASTNEIVFDPLMLNSDPDNLIDPVEFVFYYRVRVTATRPGSETFILESSMTSVTIDVQEADTNGSGSQQAGSVEETVGDITEKSNGDIKDTHNGADTQNGTPMEADTAEDAETGLPSSESNGTADKNTPLFETDDETSNTEELLLAVGAVTLFGGFGIVRSRQRKQRKSRRRRRQDKCE